MIKEKIKTSILENGLPKNKVGPDKRIIPITIAVPMLDKWLRYYYINHHISEVILMIDPTNTIMTIMVKGEDFPDFFTLYNLDSGGAEDE